jgi:excisionase family DNA binding protein
MSNGYSTSEIASIQGCKSNTVWVWIQKGYLKATRIGRNLVVSQNDFNDFLISYPYKKKHENMSNGQLLSGQNFA